MTYLAIGIFYFIMIKPIHIQAQDLEKVLKADSVSKAFFNKVKQSPVELNGLVRAQSIFYTGHTQQDPFTYLLNGSVSLKFMKYTMPLSFTYTNKGLDYAARMPLSFNRFSFSPRYKWARLYLGASSMSFSPYTLGGAQFRGAGIRLTPKGPWSGSLMYGKFYDAVNYDPNDLTVTPVFKRTGYAMQLAYKKEKLHLETSFLNAADRPETITIPDSVDQNIAPLQNVALSFKSTFSPMKEVNLSIEYASSAINYGLKHGRKQLYDMLFNEDTEISRFNAYKLNLNFNPGAITFGAGIEHIDPDYATLGAYYSRNDFQNITLNMAGNILNNKLYFSLNGGFENDNLKNHKQRKTTRTVGSAMLNFMPNKKINANFSYSNFQSFSNIQDQFDFINEETPFDNLDTLNFLQINQTAMANLTYKIKQSKTNNQMLRLLCNLNQASGLQGTETNYGTRFVTVNGNWVTLYPETNTNVSAGINSSFTTSESNHTTTWGPMITGSTSLLNKQLKTRFSLAYNQSYLNGNFSRANFNLKGALGFTMKEIHQFKIELAILMKQYAEKTDRNSFRLTLSYTLAMKKKQIYLSKNRQQ